MRTLAHAWSWLNYQTTLLGKDGLGGQATLLLLALSIACSGVGVALCARRTVPRRSAQIALTLTLACAGLAFLLGTLTARAARLRAETDLAGALAMVGIEDLDISQAASLLMTTAAVWLVPALTFLVVRLSSTWLTRALALSVAPLLLITVLASFAQADSLSTNLGCGDPALIRDGTFEAILWVRDRARSLELFITLAAAVGLALAVGAAVREARRARSVPPSALWVSATLLLFGSTAFALTRPLAHDAERLVPHESYAIAYETLCASAPLPKAECSALPEVPLVQANSNGFGLDGIPLLLRDLRNMLAEKRKLRELLAPQLAPLHAVGLVAPEEARWDQLKPLLAGLREDGFSTLWVVQRKPRGSIHSATLGVTPRHQQCCATLVELDLNGLHPTPTTTLGELLNRTAEANPTVLRLAVSE